MSFGKFIGGGLGWAVGGPIGALVGFAVGSAFDNLKSKVFVEGGAGADGATTPGDFQASLLVLSAAVMKADGKVMKSELNYVRSFFEQQFGEEETAQQMKLLKEILDQQIPVRQVCLQIRQHMPHAMRLQLLQYLFHIADADGTVDLSEVRIIRRIATYMGISARDYESMQAMFYNPGGRRSSRAGRGSANFGRQTTSLGAAYKILEVKESDSEEIIKKAYRRMAKKYHPDRLATLGSEHQNAAKEKFQKVQEAWEVIKEARGFK